MKTLRARSLFSIALIGVLGGCSSFDLYDKQKDEQAKAMKDGLATVTFANVFNDARARHAAVSEAIATQYQRLAEANAKLKLLAVLGTTENLSNKVGLQGVLLDKWAELTCNTAGDPNCAPPSQRAAAWATEFCPDDKNALCREAGPLLRYSEIVTQGLVDYDPNSLQRFQRDMKNGASQVMALALKPAPICVATQPLDAQQPGNALPKPVPAMPTPEQFEKSLPEDRLAAADLYELVYWPRCQDLLDAQYRLDWLMQASPQSGIGAALQRWRTARESLNEELKAANAARAEYDASNQAYKAALAELQADLPGAEDKAKDLLKKASGALDALGEIIKLGQKVENPVGTAAQADERIQQLREIVAALGGAKSSGDKSTLSPDVRTHLAAIASLPRLIDDSAELFEEAEEARLSPLMLEISYQEQVAIGAKRRVAAEVENVERMKQAYFTLVAQAGKIAEAQERLDVGMGLLAGSESQRLYELLNGARGNPTPAQEALLDSLALYYETEVQQEIAIQKIEYRSAAVTYQRNLDEDEIALNEWLSLARSDSQILSAYFASGMKPEDIAALLVQLVGLGGIAVGVNR